MVGTDGVAADKHAFNHAVGVAFKDGTVHECARVTFVGVADDVLLVAFLSVGSFPLHAGREASAATATEAGTLHLFDDGHPVPLLQDFGQGQVSILGDVAVDAVDVNEATVAQGDPDLIPEEGHIVDVGHPLLLNAVIEGVLGDRLSPDEVLLHHVFDPFGGHFGVVGLIGQDVNHRTHCAGAHAAALNHCDFIGQAGLLQLFHHGVPDVFAAGGHTACAIAHHAQVAVLPHLFQIGFLHLLQVSDASDHAWAPPSIPSSVGSSY